MYIHASLESLLNLPYMHLRILISTSVRNQLNIYIKFDVNLNASIQSKSPFCISHLKFCLKIFERLNFKTLSQNFHKSFYSKDTPN